MTDEQKKQITTPVIERFISIVNIKLNAMNLNTTYLPINPSSYTRLQAYKRKDMYLSTLLVVGEFLNFTNEEWLYIICGEPFSPLGYSATPKPKDLQFFCEEVIKNVINSQFPKKKM